MATLASPSAPQRKSRTRPVLKKGDMLLRLARQRAWRARMRARAETIAAIEASRRGETKRFATPAELFAALHADD